MVKGEECQEFEGGGARAHWGVLSLSFTALPDVGVGFWMRLRRKGSFGMCLHGRLDRFLEKDFRGSMG